LAFRYYLYISDSKIDMLLPQIDPGFSVRHTSEFGVSFKVLTARRTVEPADADRISRLERVIRHLQDYGDVGSVDEPGQFFWGLLPMRWGPFPANRPSSLVFFGGRSARTVVGLGGSGKHLLGSVPGVGEHDAPSSSMPAMLDQLGSVSELEDELVVEAADGLRDGLDRADDAALAAVYQAVSRLRGPAQNVEFVAKRLLHGSGPLAESGHGDGTSVLLGSPIYVAQAD
jgi:hypothetical protein